MTEDREKRLNQLEAKETRRKQQVKKYFAKRNARFLFYKAFFIKNAKEADRKALQDKLANL